MKQLDKYLINIKLKMLNQKKINRIKPLTV